jgi:ABC-type uncharacterized transport system substrate-binding protein
MIRRREFITLLGGAAVALPLAARAQQPTIPVIGFLNARSPQDTMHLVAAFRRGLGEGGFVEGQNVIIEYRWALGQYDRLPAMAAELAHRPVTLFATAGGEPAALAAKSATSTIPIVFVIGGDPVKQGLATSFNLPGGNSTGVSILTTTLEPKRVELLRELVPQTAMIGVLANPGFPAYESQLQDVQEAAHALALQVLVLPANTDLTLRRRSRLSFNGALTRSRCWPLRSLTHDATSLWPWQRATQCPRCTSFANLLRPAGW